MIKSRRIKSTNKYKVVDVLASWDRCIAQFSYRSSAPLRSRNWQFHVPCLLRPLFLIFLPFSRVSRPSVGSSGSGPEVQGKLERRAPPPLSFFLFRIHSFSLPHSLAHPLFFSQAKDLWISIATKSKPLITPVGTPILISCLFF